MADRTLGRRPEKPARRTSQVTQDTLAGLLGTGRTTINAPFSICKITGSSMFSERSRNPRLDRPQSNELGCPTNI
jgi:hypothetical protein